MQPPDMPVSPSGALDVRHFGATGDGHTDDTTALQAAIDAAGDTHSQVYIPAGVYACSTLRLRPHVTLTGCAAWSYWYYHGSVLRLVDDRAACLLDASHAVGAVIDGLALDGIGQGGQRLGKGVHGVMLHHDSSTNMDENGAFDDALRIERSLIRNFSGDGVHLHNVCVFTVRSSMVSANTGNGIYVRGWDGYVLDCWLAANGEAGYRGISVNASVTMTANRIEWNSLGGIVIRGGNHYNITGNFIDRCGGPGIWLEAEGNEVCRSFAMTGNILRRNGARGAALEPRANSHVLFDGCRGVVFTGNTLTVGQDDGDQGDVTPAYGIAYGNLRNGIIRDNVLDAGATKQLVLDLGGNDADSVLVRDNIGSLASG